MYSVFMFGRMIADRVRTDAYHRAIEKAVRPGSVVLDIGSGTGIFALLACRAGARKVYAIEPNDSIQVASDLASANGFAGRIKFIQDLSTRVDLPEPADVIVSDIRGTLPLHGTSLKTIIDARSRFLAPGGTMIPSSDTLWAAVVEASEVYSQFVEPWEAGSYGFNMRAARDMVVNTWNNSGSDVKRDQFLTPPRTWCILDYASMTTPSVGAEVRWPVTRSGTAHGCVVWFDATLLEGISYSTFGSATDEPSFIYRSAFFPFAQPVSLDAGDVVSVHLRAVLIEDDYVWRWRTRVEPRDAARGVKAAFDQVSSFGQPVSAATLRRRSASHVPVLTADGQMRRLALDLMDGRRSTGEVAEELRRQFPERFPRREDALGFASAVSVEFSR